MWIIYCVKEFEKRKRIVKEFELFGHPFNLNNCIGITYGTIVLYSSCVVIGSSRVVLVYIMNDLKTN